MQISEYLELAYIIFLEVKHPEEDLAKFCYLDVLKSVLFSK